MRSIVCTLLAAAAFGLCLCPDAEARRMDIEAGPIWDNHHAESVCPRVAQDWEREHPGTRTEWTGEWRTVESGRMSVCGVEVERRRHRDMPPPPPPHRRGDVPPPPPPHRY